MKQVLQDRSGKTVVRDVPSPTCPPGAVLVRNVFSVISSGTERSRVELSKKSLLGKARERPDLVREVIARAKREGIRSTRDAVRLKLSQETAVGYSSAGVVVEVGEATAGFRPGDRVACAGGGHANHAEIVSVPANLCTPVPDGVPLESAAMTTIAAIALHGLRLADVRVGDRVGVVGCGLVGQIACRLVAAAGGEVFAVDLDERRVQQALEHGATHGIVVGPTSAEDVLALSGGIGLDEVLITAAAPTNDPLVLAAACARDRGAVVLVGDVPIQVPRAAFYDKELSFRVSRSYGPGRYDLDYEERGLDYPIGYVRWTEKRNMEAVLELQRQGRLDLRDLVEQVLPVDEAAEAYAKLTGPAESRPRGALVLSYGTEETGLDTLSIASPAAAVESVARATAGPARVGLVGPGSFALRVLVPAFQAHGAHLEAVAGGSGPSAEAASRSGGFARVLSEGDLVSDAGVDVVVVATRHESHARLAEQALRAGKHVFCEKPLALTLDELEAVAGAAAGSEGILTVGFNRRFSPLLQRVRSHLAGHGPMTAVYRVSAGALPADHWTHDLVQGGGRMLGEGCHFVDSLAYLVGAPVRSVVAFGYGAPERSVQARDNVVVTLSFADGSVGTIVYAADGSPRLPKERVEAFSGSRSAVLDDYMSVDLLGPDGAETVKPGGQDKGHSAEVEAFLAGVASGHAPIPLAEILNVSTATLAIVESLRTGRVVSVTAPGETA